MHVSTTSGMCSGVAQERCWYGGKAAPDVAAGSEEQSGSAYGTAGKLSDTEHGLKRGLSVWTGSQAQLRPSGHETEHHTGYSYSGDCHTKVWSA